MEKRQGQKTPVNNATVNTQNTNHFIGKLVQSSPRNDKRNTISINKKDNQVKAASQEKYIVNDKSPIWICPHVLKGEQKCIFGLCSSCYSDKEPNNRKRRRDRSDESNVCMHNKVSNFSVFVDSTYFTVNYQQKNRFVAKCGNCHVPFNSNK